ncbi:MAG: alpha-L-rhamnosidase [Gemmatimonadetes bacterium]|nr:alpha-L-rhamnosidase [Gemmatimonadota bacterium]
MGASGSSQRATDGSRPPDPFWLGDAIADQREIGSFPDVIPDVLTRGQPKATSSAGWGDAGVIIPWTMYLTYGDTRLLARQYPSMKRYVEYQRNVAGDKLLWNSGWHYGDWLAFSTIRADYPGRDNHLGALGGPEARQLVSGNEHELVQSLCVRRDW